MHVAAATAAMLALLGVDSAVGDDAAGSESTALPAVEPRPLYSVDTTTSFCYWIQQGLDVSTFDASKLKLEGKGSECPVLVTVSQTTNVPIVPDSDVEYRFTATLNLKANKFNLTQLEAPALDPTTRRPVQIAHANLHACTHNSLCDVFHDGLNRRISNQQTANFTDGKAAFTQTLHFAVGGEYNVFAHVVLPGKSARDETYQFVAFTTTSVGSTNSSGSNNLTSGTNVETSAAPTVPTPRNNSSSPGQSNDTKSTAASVTSSVFLTVATITAALLCLGV